MSYDPDNLSALHYTNGFTVWHYKTKDLKAEVCKPGYFDEAATMLRVGDKLFINTNIDRDCVSFDDSVKSNESGLNGNRIVTLQNTVWELADGSLTEAA